MQYAKLDFEIDVGTNVINLADLKEVLDYMVSNTEYRIYFLLIAHSLRPAEPMQLTWDNFRGGRLIFKPKKQSKRGVTRRIQFSENVWAELMEYKHSRIFPLGKPIFAMTHETVRCRFDKIYRQCLSEIWQKKSDNLRSGRVAQYNFYTLQSFRTTAATLAYHFFSLEYGHGEIALARTCRWMGHSAEKMTAMYYIKRIDQLGLDRYPRYDSLLELMDNVIYGSMQERITKYVDYEPQSRLIEYTGCISGVS